RQPGAGGKVSPRVATRGLGAPLHLRHDAQPTPVSFPHRGAAMRKGTLCLLGAALLAALPAAAADAPKKKIVLIGMDRDHARGEHEYMAGLAILEECLKQTPGVEVQVVKVGKELPEDTKFLDDANTIVCFLKVGGDLLFRKKEVREKTEALMKKGVGFVAL